MKRRRYTEQQFREAVADPNTKTIADLCRALGLVPAGGDYESVYEYAERVGLDVRRLRPRRMNRVNTISAQQLATAVRLEVSMSATIRHLELSDCGSTRRHLRQRIEKQGLSTEHWLGPGWAAGTRRPRKRPSLDSVLVQGRRIQGTRLRELLIAEGITEHRCADCRLAEWHGELIPLEVDHVNGDGWDNRLENLRLLCPNCHARTPTYRGRNIGRRYRGPAGTERPGAAP